jgi:hypothetical protein
MTTTDDTAIDWSRPIVTNAGKPATVMEGPDKLNGFYHVNADWHGYGLPSTLWTYPNGNANVSVAHHIRNATPAEILAHPDVWPDRQDWARSHVDEPPRVAAPADGVMVTREKFVAMMRAETPMHVNTIHSLADALGIPPDPPKLKPWEAAYEAWAREQGSGSIAKKPFEAGVMFALNEALEVTFTDAQGIISRRILGDAS